MNHTIDLHLHTYHSDGTLSPAELVECAAVQKLQIIAITDHDTVAGIDEARAVGAQAGVDVIPGIEFSVAFSTYDDVHLLAYYLDYANPALLERLERFRTHRSSRAEEIIERINHTLQKEGKSTISNSDLFSQSMESVGRPHIARVLVTKGLARDKEDAFTRYLIPCNVPKAYFPVDDALAEIRKLNGVSVLAHPMSISTDRHILSSVIEELVRKGLDGLEVYNNMCYKDDSVFLSTLVKRFGLLPSGGSDFHDPQGPVLPGVYPAPFPIDCATANAIKDLALRKRNPSAGI